MAEPRSNLPVTDTFVRAVEELTACLQHGQLADIESIIARFPEFESELREVAETMNSLASWGQAVADSDTDLVEDDLADRRLGDYRILREIGRGGMGVVYEAEQLSLQRKVALKVLPMAAFLDTRQLDRFRNEARAAASLRHPGIVAIHGVGCERSVHFYAMELVDGVDLASVIREVHRRHGSDSALQLSDTTLVEICQRSVASISRRTGGRSQKSEFRWPNHCTTPMRKASFIVM